MKIINKNHVDHYIWGSSAPNENNQWLDALTNNGKILFEGITILDYGCGGGRLCNYISTKINNFIYYGLEPPYGMGPDTIKFAKKHYKDPRVIFDFIGSYTELAAIKTANYAILGSVFTHLIYEDAVIIMDKLRTIIANGGKIIASIFINEKYQLDLPLVYDCPNCYAKVSYTKEQLKNWHYQKIGTFLAQGHNLHKIFMFDGYRESTTGVEPA